MADAKIGEAVRDLCADAADDVRLLNHFTERRDRDAFAALMRRHGPMVLGVCRRVLRNEQDAEDAFQATFLVLARKAASLHRRELLGNWLYGVAYRTALRARTLSARRLAREKEMARPEALPEESPDDRAELLDRELSWLPEKYRTPIVLCELQGMTYREAARLLGWPEGTLAGRLSRGKALLARRMGASLSAVLATTVARAETVPARLTEGTLSALDGGAGAVSPQVVALVDGVMRTLLADRLRGVIALVFLVFSLAGAGVLAGSARTAGQPTDPPPERKPDPGRRILTDLLGDPLPEGAVARLGTWRLRHRGPVHALAPSPDGKMILSAGGADHTIRMWDPATGREIRRVEGEAQYPASLAVTADGKQFFTAGDMSLRETDSGRLVRQFARQAANCAALAPDGKTIATTGIDGFIRLWDFATGEEIGKFPGHEGPTYGLSYALDGKVLASMGNDKTVRVWDPATGKELRRLATGGNFVYALAVSPDGKVLATGGLDKEVCLWDAAKGESLRRWQAHEGQVNHVTYSPDGKTIATAGGEGRLRIWDSATGKMLRQAEGLWSATYLGVGSLRFSPDGRTLLCSTDCIVLVLDADTLRDRFPAVARQHCISSIAFSADGRTIATGHGDINYHWVPGRVRLWETATGKEVGDLGGPPGPIFGVALTPDGKTVIGAGLQTGIRLWDRDTGKERTIGDLKTRFFGVALSPDGKLLAAQESYSGVAHLWDLGAGKLIGQLPSTGLSAGSFSPDGKLLALGEGNDNIGLFDAATGNPVRRITGKPLYNLPLIGLVPPMHRIAFAPDGKTLASWGGSDTVRLWDAGTGKLLHLLPGHKDYADTATFSPDGRIVAVGTSDGLIRLWEVQTGKELLLLRGHQDRVVALAFSPDGRLLASGSRDTTGLVWDMKRLREAERRE